MPRIFATDHDYNATQGAVDFVNGAAAVLATATEAIAFFTAAGFTIDSNKHSLTVMDLMTLAQVRAIADYMGIAYVAGDTKAQVIRKVETGISALKLGALTVASTDGAVLTKTDIAVTEALGANHAFYYKTHATIAPAPLYGDQADSTWTKFSSGDDIVATTGHKITVVEAVEATGFILNSGNDTVDSKDA
jgi:hypothetical protein